MQSCLSTVKALADETRLRILRILMTGTYNVNELVAILSMGQSRVSRHLRILSDAGLVRPRRQGTWVYYGLTGLWENESRPGFLPSFADELSASPLPPAAADDRGGGANGTGSSRQSARAQLTSTVTLVGLVRIS